MARMEATCWFTILVLDIATSINPMMCKDNLKRTRISDFRGFGTLTSHFFERIPAILNK